MKQKIRDKWTGKVIYDEEADTLRDVVERAAKGGANLIGANLDGANLAGANLDGANLDGAHLAYANLTYANLAGAHLTYANLAYANLTSAHLTYAKLAGANLTGAKLTGAKLTGANLTGATLTGACGIDPNRVCQLRILLDQPGKIRAYKLVDKSGGGAFFKSETVYAVGGTYEVQNANEDINDLCGFGLHVATLDWVMRQWCEGWRILIAEFEATDIAAIPTATDGKFRVRKLTIVGEKNLKELGLVP